MGEMAIKISKVDQKALMEQLQTAFAEEWLAYYQYWVGAQVAVGPMRKAIAAEFMEHANEELDHAGKLAKRIVELGETPLINPNMWEKFAMCKYDEPSNPCVTKLLEQNLIAERCAIARYQKICEMTDGKDYVTFHMSREILDEEVEHEQEIGDYINDIAANCKVDDPKITETL